jgi:23S rRNA pseudouridine2605 synthase
MSHSGAASRRAAEKLIAAGRVTVNGAVVSNMGVKVAPADDVRLDGIKLVPETTFSYIALHKPVGYICSASDPEKRPLAKDLLPRAIGERLYNVGRLDFMSSGLILFTNDGDFTRRLSHPSSGIEKEYVVKTSAPIPDLLLKQFKEGVVVDKVLYLCYTIERIAGDCVDIVLVEGKNREIRKVFSYFHLHPLSLHRVRIGPVRIGNLGVGESRALRSVELEGLLGNRD